MRLNEDDGDDIDLNDGMDDGLSQELADDVESDLDMGDTEDTNDATLTPPSAPQTSPTPSPNDGDTVEVDITSLVDAQNTVLSKADSISNQLNDILKKIEDVSKDFAEKLDKSTTEVKLELAKRIPTAQERQAYSAMLMGADNDFFNRRAADTANLYDYLIGNKFGVSAEKDESKPKPNPKEYEITPEDVKSYSNFEIRKSLDVK